MDKINIFCEAGNQELSEWSDSGMNTLNIPGKICFQINNIYYPGKDWTDYPFLVITMWMEDFIEYLKEGKAELIFMEGTYTISLAKRSGDLIKVSFTDRVRKQ